MLMRNYIMIILNWFKNLTKDAYYIKRFYGAIEFYNCHLVSIKNNNDIGWYWREPVHAYMTYQKNVLSKCR